MKKRATSRRALLHVARRLEVAHGNAAHAPLAELGERVHGRAARATPCGRLLGIPALAGPRAARHLPHQPQGRGQRLGEPLCAQRPAVEVQVPVVVDGCGPDSLGRQGRTGDAGERRHR